MSFVAKKKWKNKNNLWFTYRRWTDRYTIGRTFTVHIHTSRTTWKTCKFRIICCCSNGWGIHWNYWNEERKQNGKEFHSNDCYYLISAIISLSIRFQITYTHRAIVFVFFHRLAHTHSAFTFRHFWVVFWFSIIYSKNEYNNSSHKHIINTQRKVLHFFTHFLIELNRLGSELSEWIEDEWEETDRQTDWDSEIKTKSVRSPSPCHDNFNICRNSSKILSHQIPSFRLFLFFSRFVCESFGFVLVGYSKLWRAPHTALWRSHCAAIPLSTKASNEEMQTHD